MYPSVHLSIYLPTYISTYLSMQVPHGLANSLKYDLELLMVLTSLKLASKGELGAAVPFKHGKREFDPHVRLSMYHI